MSFQGAVLYEEASNTIFLETSHEDTWHWLLNLPIAIQSARLWRELSISVSKSYQSFPNESESTNVNLWWLSIILVLSCCCSEWWFMSIFDSWCSYHQHLKTNCSPLQFLFSKFAVSRNSSLKWYYGLMVSNFLGTSLFWINEKVFSLGYEVFLFLWDEFPRCSFEGWNFQYYTPRDPHEIFWHWLLIRPIVVQCAYPWRELSIFVNKSYQCFSRMNSWVSPRVRTNRSQPLW